MKIGDVVKLRSGSEKMTVEQVKSPYATNSVVHCVWFDENTNLRRAEFQSAALVIVN